ncbi:sulfite exporter TauE/SafE family protein [Streptomyces panaciradicis]|uniref:sulfite exporter TauE/SafE family protein n=1 Tax=Streptomyces panaciradicis TaxID=1470261 RepID=UPI00201CF238|nr:sulfite exporter TauE/SafE family protein [Streptomyces panaciradicis]MCL6671789.1 sulfite exporter TauE/SafE family protein [Streptomyces panaciradicis]
MRTLILLALAGLGAQLVDGSLGMAHGVISTVLLLALGTTPAAASAVVHFAQIGTGLVSGASHARFGNVDWQVVTRIGVPGAVGAFAGATVLSHLSTALAEPVMAVILLVLGLFVTWRFTVRGVPRGSTGRPPGKRFLVPVGLAAGFLGATGGGGWGLIGTPALLASGRLEPRKVVGSVDASKALVAVAASLGFLFSLGSQGVNWSWVLAFLVGGTVIAPVAAWLARFVAPRVLGSTVGGLIVVLNARTLLTDWFHVPGTVRAVVYVVLHGLWAAALTHSVRAHRRERDIRTEPATEPEPVGARAV